jgi:hypothetical protein
MRNPFCCFRSINLESLIDDWISEQPLGNEGNLNIAKTRILEAHSTSSTQLYLARLNLSSFPPLEKLAPHLEKLYLSNNQISEIPKSIRSFADLKDLDLSNNQLRTLPESIGSLVNLNFLSITRNCLTTLPESIGGLQNLRTLFLSQNQLSSLPESFGNLLNLNSLWLNDNNITYEQLPQSINNRNIQLIIGSSASPTNNPSTDFFTIIENNANFTDAEKSQIATRALEIDYLKTHNPEQTLQDNVVDIKNLLTSENPQPNIEPLINFLKEFISIDGSYQRADEESKKLLSRQILEVLLIINDKKNDEEFIKGATDICASGQESCADRTALYFYFLKNFATSKTTEQLDSMFQKFQQEESRSEEARPSQSEAQGDLDPKKLIESLGNQATFNYILKMAKSKCEQIKANNPDFSEDVEVYINYLRIFNRKLLEEGIDSGLPAIQNQMYYTGANFELYQPNLNEITDLTKVLKSEDKTEIAEFLAQNIRDETSTTLVQPIDKTQIYKNINLAISEITESYINIDNSAGNSLQLQNTANEMQEIRKEIISSELKEVLVKILDKEKFKIDFGENKTTEIKEKIENKLREKGLLPSREATPTLAQNPSSASVSGSLVYP